MVLSVRFAPLLYATVGSIALLVCTSVNASGQAISQWSGEPSAAPLPQPVRGAASQLVKHPVTHPNQIPSEFHARGLVDNHVPHHGANPNLHPHQVLVPPDRQISNDSNVARRSKPHPLAHLKHRRTIQPPPAMMPESHRHPTWKTPYSYGYFGSSGSRHWSVHHGYRDHVTEWRLR